MLSYIYGAQLLVLRVSRDAWRDAETRDQGRSVKFESVRTRKLEKSMRIFWRHFPKDISINEKMKNTRSSYNTTNAFYQKNLPISQVRTCVFAKRTPRLWYFVRFCTLLFSRKISHLFAMLRYYKLKIFTKMGRWKSCHFYNMRSVSKPRFA